jgi:hypothetical protein
MRALPALEVKEDAKQAILSGETFTLVFDKLAGTLSSWRVNGEDLLALGPICHLTRALIDNDRGGEGTYEYEWKRAGYGQLKQRVRSVKVDARNARAIKVDVKTRLGAPVVAPVFDARYVYTVYGSGHVHLETTLTPLREDLPHLPRVGVMLRMPEGFDQFSWYGNGPGESYADSKNGVYVDVWKGTVEEQHTDYVVPQENGNKTDVRWGTLSNARGVGLRVMADDLLNMTVQHYATEDLDRALHIHELPRRPWTEWHLDLGQCGIGSMGPGVLPAYRLPAKEYSFGMTLVPVGEETQPPVCNLHQPDAGSRYRMH